MKLKPLLTATLCLSALTTPALAAPYCSQMLSADGLERRYQRLAPIYNEAETGWIIASDQLQYRYVLSATEQALLTDLVDTLAARGTELAMLIAPPRPVVAGQDTVDATTGTPGAYDMTAQAAAFDQMIAQIAATGAVAPNLLDMMQSQPDLAPRYFFARDTHWTNLGAAHSALALASAMDGATGPRFDPSALPILEQVEEPGSLSRIVTATCDQTPEPEHSPLFDYSGHLPQSGGLLGDIGDGSAPAVLLGTSYSDRYGRDQYQSADALAAALNLPVENRSVSGGGMIGPFETYVLTGTYAAATPDLLIWEFPYTYQLTEARLRQLLGALNAPEIVAPGPTAQLTGDEATFESSADLGTGDLLGLRMGGGLTHDMVLRLRFADGSDQRLRLRRKTRMDAVAELQDWWLDLRGVPAPLTGLSIELRGDHDVSDITLLTPQLGG